MQAHQGTPGLQTNGLKMIKGKSPIEIDLAAGKVDLKKIDKLSEVKFTRMVIKYAKLQGWQVAHFRPALTQKGHWITAVGGDGKGFPDLFMVRDGEILVAELKVGYNAMTPEQHVWMNKFAKTPAAVKLWYPKNWDDIVETLQRK